MRKYISLLIGLGFFFGTLALEKPIDLSGLWRFQLDPMGFGKTPGSELYLSKLTESIVLPGSMDESGKGIPNAVSHVDRLSRKFEYCGQAWYQREVEIPESWQGKEIILTLERCHWEKQLPCGMSFLRLYIHWMSPYPQMPDKTAEAFVSVCVK